MVIKSSCHRNYQYQNNLFCRIVDIFLDIFVQYPSKSSAHMSSDVIDIFSIFLSILDFLNTFLWTGSRVYFYKLSWAFFYELVKKEALFYVVLFGCSLPDKFNTFFCCCCRKIISSTESGLMIWWMFHAISTSWLEKKENSC
jgi:hypothetical protein